MTESAQPAASAEPTAPDESPASPVNPFSTVIRSATWEQHMEANHSPFITALLGGDLSVTAFRRYTEQLWFVYRALEEGAQRLADDPVAAPFLHSGLPRSAALETDLDHLHGGAEWRDGLRPLPATAAYTTRIAEVAATWPGGFVAHHYTRYMGDLAGGQAIRATAEKTWGFAHKGDGVRFYVFDRLGNPAAFKRAYRAALDTLPTDELEAQRIVEECKRAFTLNTAVFRELGEEFPAVA